MRLDNGLSRKWHGVPSKAPLLALLTRNNARLFGRHDDLLGTQTLGRVGITDGTLRARRDGLDGLGVRYVSAGRNSRYVVDQAEVVDLSAYRELREFVHDAARDDEPCTREQHVFYASAILARLNAKAETVTARIAAGWCDRCGAECRIRWTVGADSCCGECATFARTEARAS